MLQRRRSTCVFPPLAGIVVDSKPRVMQFPVLSREEELYWLALKLVPGLGSRTSGKLLDRFRTPQAIFRASRTELEGAGVSGAIAQSIANQHKGLIECASRPGDTKTNLGYLWPVRGGQ